MRSVALLLLLGLAPLAQGQAPVLIEVRAPGHVARTIEDKVLVPLEQRLGSLEHVRLMRGLALDGRCVLQLDLEKDADPEEVRLVVQNRLATPLPPLPPGCTPRILPPIEDAFMLIAVTPPDGKSLADTGDWVKALMWPYLAGVPGVAHIQALGVNEGPLRIDLDPHKLKQHGLNPGEVVATVRDALENFEGGRIAGERVTLKNTDRLEKVGDLPLKEGKVFLRDVAMPLAEEEPPEACGVSLRAEQGPSTHRAIFLLVHLSPGKLNRAAKKGLENALGRLRGLRGCPSCEGQLIPADCPTVALRFPDAADLKAREKQARTAVKALFEAAQVRQVFWVAPADDNEAFFWIVADPGKKAELARALGARLARIKGVSSRIGALNSPLFPWPGKGAQLVVRLRGKDFSRVRQAAERLGKRLRKDAGVLGVDSFPALRPVAAIDIDWDKAALCGLTPAAIRRSLASFTNRIDPPISCGRLQIAVGLPKVPRQMLRSVEDLEILPIESGDPAMNLMLRDIASVRSSTAPCGAIPHEDGHPCVILVASGEDRALEDLRAEIPRLGRDLADKGVEIDLEAGSGRVVPRGEAPRPPAREEPDGKPRPANSPPKREGIPAARKEEDPTLRLVRPKAEKIARSVGQARFVESYERTAIRPRVGGYVKKWNVDIGDKVKKGDVLAEQLAPELEAVWAEKKARLKAAEGRVEMAKQAVKAKQADVKTAQARLAAARAMAKANPESKEAAEAAVLVAEAELLSKQASAEQSQLAVKVADANREVAAIEASKCEGLVRSLTLTAPYDGVIVERNVNTWDFVAPTDRSEADRPNRSIPPLYVIDRIDKVRVTIAIPEEEASDVSVGMKAKVKIPSVQDEPISADITRLSWVLSSDSRRLHAVIDLPNPRGLILPGMYAYGKVDIKRSRQTWTLPLRAFEVRGERTFLWTSRHGRAVHWEVQTGARSGEWIEVLRRRTVRGGEEHEWAPFDGSEKVLAGDLSELSDDEEVKVSESLPSP